MTTEAGPVEVRFGAGEPGEHALAIRATDARGNSLLAATAFYVFGEGYSPWRFDQENRVDLVVERDRYAPGETARVLVKSPWDRATALITLERAGVLETRIEELRGTMPLLELPVTSEHAPNVFVSVVLLRGRIEVPPDREMTDPGKPAYRIGYCELSVPPREHGLSVRLEPGRAEYRPGQSATARVHVDGSDGGARRASVTLWAVDAGILALTGYRTPDLLAGFFERRGLGVVTAESRTRLVGRRTYGTKGDRAGGGGGVLESVDALRSDFRAVAVWRGDVVTDERGDAVVTFLLPDSLTTYRLMAVAMAGTEEFGSGETEFRVSKPLGLEPALPRFLRPSDRASAGVVVRNRTKETRRVEVRATIPKGATVRIDKGGAKTVEVPAGGSAVVQFDLTGVEPGEARVRFDARARGPDGESDAMEVTLPVIAGGPVETVATFLSTTGQAREAVVVPGDVYESVGGLEVRVAPTALVDATTGVDYLLRYPHRCAEQMSSRLLGVLAAARLGAGFSPREVEGLRTEDWEARAVEHLSSCQRPSGGFAFWPDGGEADDALTAHVAWSLSAAKAAGIAVDPRATDRAGEYLSRLLRRERWPWGEADGWTTKVLASYALARLGRPEPGYFQVLYDRRGEGRPVWGLALLAATMLESNRADPRAALLVQEVRNSLVVEAATARLEEPAPEWGWRLWWSGRRGTAIALLALLGADASDPTTERIAAALLDHLARDRSQTTQDAAWTLQALASYREHHEQPGSPVEVAVTIGRERIIDAMIDPASPRTEVARVAMDDLRARAGRSRDLPLAVDVQGGGRAYVAASLTFLSRRADRPAVAQGISLERRFLDEKRAAVSGVRAGSGVDVEVAVTASASQRFLVVEVPLPAGLEPVDLDLATAARRPGAEDDGVRGDEIGEGEFFPAWDDVAPGFDHAELRDDRVILYASHLPAGSSTTRIPCRATTPGSFAVSPAHAEQMYAPEVFGTTAGTSFEVFP